MKTNSSRNQTGSSLVVVMTVLATLMVIVGIASEYTTNVSRHVQRSNTLESAIAVGDSCMEILFANWRGTCRGTIAKSDGSYATPTQWLKTGDFSNIPLPTSTQIPNITGFGATRTDYYTSGTANPPTVSDYQVVAADAEWNALPGASATPEPMFGQLSSQITSLDPNANPAIKTTSLVQNYIASADITLPALGPNGRVTAKIRRLFQKQQISPWNFAIFYVDPLEIHPGPLFTVTGWVHTNSDLYTAHNTLTFADKVTYGADWHVAFMPGDAQHNADTPAAPNYPSNLPPARDQSLQPFGLDSTSIFSTADPNPNNDSYRELIEPPKAGYSDPMAASRYWDQAGIAIEVKNNPTAGQPDIVTIGTPNADGTLTSLNPPSSGTDTRTTAQKNLYNMFSGAITTNQSIQDNREGATLGITTLDVSKMLQSGQNPPAYKTGFNGIIYMYNKSATASSRKGIRIAGGSSIPSSPGFTLASNNPVYIQGDFNTGATGSSVPSNSPSNLNSDGTYKTPANPPAPQVNNYTRAPASVVADAVTILSNSWSDANAGTVPAASATTVNTAIISGIVPTAAAGGDGSYSGGAENFPRFLENWSNKPLTYYGSMVELYKSQQSIGEWGKANVYSPPAREWLFDTNFKTNPPPGSIMIYSYIKGKWAVL